MIIAGMSPTAKRKEAIDFSDAYYTSQLVIVVRKAEYEGKYANATKLADFKGAKSQRKSALSTTTHCKIRQVNTAFCLKPL